MLKCVGQAIILLSIGRKVLSVIESIVILPHGDFAFDPTLVPAESQAAGVAWKLFHAAHHVGRLVGNTDPDLIFLSTPHGISLANDFGVYMGDAAAGSAWIGKDLMDRTEVTPYRTELNISLDRSASEKILSYLSDENVTEINSIQSSVVPLYWGEVIPLSFVDVVNSEAPSMMKRGRLLNHVVWSHPLRRFNQSTTMVTELLRVGRRLAKLLESLNERVVVLVSGDLSHTHRDDGPYGYSSASADFDLAVAEWADDPCCNQYALLQKARRLQQRALSCGFVGLVMAHGMLGCQSTCCHRSQFVSRLWAWGNVTYYGMMVASLTRSLVPTQDIAVSS